MSGEQDLKLTILVSCSHIHGINGSTPVSLVSLIYCFRKSSSVNMGSPATVKNQHSDAKRAKTEGHVSVDKTTQGSGKMIELDFVSSDEDIWEFSTEDYPLGFVVEINVGKNVLHDQKTMASARWRVMVKMLYISGHGSFNCSFERVVSSANMPNSDNQAFKFLKGEK